MNKTSEKGEVPSDFRKTLIKPLYKKNDKSECGYYRGISLVSLGSKYAVIWYFLDWEML